MMIRQIEAEAEKVFGPYTRREWEETVATRTESRCNRVLALRENPPKLAERPEPVAVVKKVGRRVRAGDDTEGVAPKRKRVREVATHDLSSFKDSSRCSDRAKHAPGREAR